MDDLATQHLDFGAVRSSRGVVKPLLGRMRSSTGCEAVRTNRGSANGPIRINQQHAGFRRVTIDQDARSVFPNQL